MNNLISHLKELSSKEERCDYISNLKLDKSDNKIPLKTCENILNFLGI
jgi:hypothetical protein